MEPDTLFPALFLVLPIIIFYQIFRQSWVDRQLFKSALLGFALSLFAVLLVKIIYHPIEYFIEIDLRTFLTSPGSLWISLFTCIAIIGFVEEGVKAAFGMLAAYYLGTFRRPTALFMSFSGCALGFSFIENFQYFTLYGSEVLYQRMLLSTTAHLFFAAVSASIIGYSIISSKRDSTASVKILLGIVLAAIFHGLFDFFLFNLDMLAVIGILIVQLAIYFVGIYEAWLAVLKTDLPTTQRLMICKQCNTFMLGCGRFCNFCGSRLIISHKVEPPRK